MSCSHSHVCHAQQVQITTGQGAIRGEAHRALCTCTMAKSDLYFNAAHPQILGSPGEVLSCSVHIIIVIQKQSAVYNLNKETVIVVESIIYRATFHSNFNNNNMAQHPYTMHMHSAELVPQKPGAQLFPVSLHRGPEALATSLPRSAQREHLATHTHTCAHRENHLAHRLNDTPHCLLMAAGHTAAITVTRKHSLNNM